MYGYIYLTINNITGKKYIGKHRSISFDDSYKGSGKYLIKAFNKYGKENFTCSILCECDSLEELNIKEIEYIKNFKAVESSDYYNLARGGEGNTAERSEETLQKYRASHLGYKPTDIARQHLHEAALKRKKRKPFKHKKPMTEEHKRKIVEARRLHDNYKVSAESRLKMSLAHKNQVPWNKGLRFKNNTVDISSTLL